MELQPIVEIVSSGEAKLNKTDKLLVNFCIENERFFPERKDYYRYRVLNTLSWLEFVSILSQRAELDNTTRTVVSRNEKKLKPIMMEYILDYKFMHHRVSRGKPAYLDAHRIKLVYDEARSLTASYIQESLEYGDQHTKAHAAQLMIRMEIAQQTTKKLLQLEPVDCFYED